jgi:hypothetical protein
MTKEDKTWTSASDLRFIAKKKEFWLSLAAVAVVAFGLGLLF